MSRGRPAAPTFIVPVAELMDVAAIHEENWCMWELRHELDNQMMILEWLARRGLIRNSNDCNKCDDTSFSLNTYKQGVDGYRWACKCCKATKSVRDQSFFGKSHLSLSQVLRILYGWSKDYTQQLIKHEAQLGINDVTIVDWCNFCREVCEADLIRNPSQVGGISEDGEPIVVEVDETKFFHRKYHRGEWNPGHWVFGGVERGSSKCFLIEVPDRTAPTLEALVLQFILPGTHIVTDGWRSYGNLARIGNGIYTHSIVNHTDNFVDRDHPETHTQAVEGFWMHAKRKIRRQLGTSEALFPSYMHEFLWRWRHKNMDLFAALISCINDQYPL